jgi:sporulation protein YlmC with PRC-barrel domain
MKDQIIGSALLAAVSLGAILTAGCAATPPTSASALVPAVTEHQATPEANSDAAWLGLINRTTALVGKKVMTREEKGLGKVEDLMLDLSTGQVIAALVSVGTDDQLATVPARCFWTASKSKILLNTDRQTFESAARCPKADLAQTWEPSRLNESFQHFGQRAPEAPAPGASGFCSAVRLIGMRVVSQTNEALGQVEDIMVDVPAGRIAYLVIQPVGVAGAQSSLYVVPPQATRIDVTGASLTLKADQAHFLAGPHFQQGYWTDMARPELAAAVLQHYGLQPVAAGQPDPTRQPSRLRVGTSDQDITVAIVTEIVRNDRAFPTRDLKITTTQGRVTLTGRVKNEKQKQQLGDAAARVVGAENVNNQLATPASK